MQSEQPPCCGCLWCKHTTDSDYCLVPDLTCRLTWMLSMSGCNVQATFSVSHFCLPCWVNLSDFYCPADRSCDNLIGLYCNDIQFYVCCHCMVPPLWQLCACHLADQLPSWLFRSEKCSYASSIGLMLAARRQTEYQCEFTSKYACLQCSNNSRMLLQRVLRPRPVAS